MRKKIEIIQIGGKKLNFPSEVIEKFNHVMLPGNYNFISDNEQMEIFQENKFNPKKNRTIFVLGNDAILLQNFPSLLEQLPAYQVLFDSKTSIKESQRKILDRKFSIPIDLENEDKLQNIVDIALDSSQKQYGYKLSMDYLEVRESFKGTYRKKGNCYLELSGDFGQEMKQIISWKIHPHGIEANSRVTFTPEIAITSGALELEFKIFLIDQSTNEITNIFKGSPEEFRKQIKIISNESDYVRFIGVSLYAKGGVGEIEIGQIHFRNHLSNNSMMLSNGKRIIDLNVRNGELFYYFHPGDLKPPLAVYFSGYRSAEGFEGRGMMGRMGCPFILIGDPRLEGGNFYVGSDVLEHEVVKVIKEKLKWLGFTNEELILSGLSMGTFGSLYYAADLEPAAVIIGKPLANIGSIAMNERIKRPEMWGTSLDMVMHFGDKANNDIAENLNEKFWNKFKTGVFKNTIFAIAYMKDDDYDNIAFQMIADNLRKNSPEAVILHKGLIGRHNDNTLGVNTWFIKQYRNILYHDFGRKLDYRL